MGVTDFNVAETSGFARRNPHARGKAGIRPTHGSSATAYLQAMCGQIPWALSDTALLSSRPVFVHGLRATDLSRKPARHRDLSARAQRQALSPWNSRRNRPQHLGRRQRDPRLAHLSGFRHQPHPNRPQALCRGQLWRRVETYGLRSGFDDDRSVPGTVSLGALSQTQGCGQTAHAHRLAWQYPDLHPYLRRHKNYRKHLRCLNTEISKAKYRSIIEYHL